MVVIAIIKLKKNKKAICLEEKIELKKRGFQIVESSRKIILDGTIKIDGNYEDKDKYYLITGEEFKVQIVIDKVNEKLPEIIETSQIVNYKYHHFSNGKLCLGSSIELWEYYNEDSSIVKYIDRFLIPYFFRYCCIKDYGDFPVKEYSHKNGIKESYEDILGIKEKDKIISMIELYLGDKNCLCPCGSLSKFKSCHYKILNDKIKRVPKRVIKNDLKILKRLNKKNKFNKYL